MRHVLSDWVETTKATEVFSTSTNGSKNGSSKRNANKRHDACDTVRSLKFQFRSAVDIPRPTKIVAHTPTNGMFGASALSRISRVLDVGFDADCGEERWNSKDKKSCQRGPTKCNLQHSQVSNLEVPTLEEFLTMPSDKSDDPSSPSSPSIPQSRRPHRTDRMGVSELLWMTSVDKSYFKQLAPLGNCSGGTALFYDLRYKTRHRPLYIKSDSFWIGKDLSHATDELGFYEEMRELVLDPKTPLAWKEVGTRWCCCCAGVMDVARMDGYSNNSLMNDLSSPSISPPQTNARVEQSETKLLVLQNLRDGFRRLRMLDLKIGSVTAVGGWMGKSEFRAWKNHHIDRLTNSAVESYRLEGIDNPPGSLETYFEQSGQSLVGFFGGAKKAKRFLLQCMRSGEFLNIWLDCRGMFPISKLNEKYAHSVLLHTIRQLRRMMSTFTQLDEPQMWIGSSIALGFDTEPSPEWIKRGADGEEYLDEEAMSQKVLVKAFDWGRSELNSPLKNCLLDEKSWQQREKYWKIYLNGLSRLLWECARLYVNRVASPAWRSLVFELTRLHTLHSDVVAAAMLPVTSVDLGEVYTINLTNDQVVEARLNIVFSAFSPLHISVIVKSMSISRKSGRYVVGCVAFSNPDDMIAYSRILADGKGSQGTPFKGRVCPQYTRLFGNDSLETKSSVSSLVDSPTVMPLNEVFEFIADPTRQAKKELAHALGIPVDVGRFPPFVGNSAHDLACAQVFQEEMATRKRNKCMKKTSA